MKVGIFGGAFNPPHREHVNIVKHLIDERKYDRVLIIPSVNPPHKKSVVTAFADRLEMVKIAFRDIPQVEISDIENRDNVVHYSYDTIGDLRALYTNDELEFIIGGDSMIDFHKWYRPLDIAKMITIVVVPRGVDDMDIMNAEIDKFNSLGGHIVKSRYIAEEISSSYLRCQLYLHDKDVDVDRDILSYIVDNNLYSDYDALLDRVKDAVKPSRFEHIKGVARYAMKLNEGLRLDFNSVMVATLLHDVAKYRSSEGYDMVPRDAIGTPVEHAFLGAEIAKREFNVDDEAIIDAIRYHCTARPNMSTLEKLVYSADMLELGRNYDGVEHLRNVIEKDFEAGFRACLNATYEHVKMENNPVYPLTVEAVKYYKCEEN